MSDSCNRNFILSGSQAVLSNLKLFYYWSGLTDDQVFVDASTVGKRPTELAWVYSPEVELGAWAAPLVWAPNQTRQTVRTIGCRRLTDL